MKTVLLIVASAIVVGGAVAKLDEFVEVSNGEARDLLNRGKCRIPTEAELAEAGITFASGTVDGELNPELQAFADDRAEQAAEREADAAEAAEGIVAQEGERPDDAEPGEQADGQGLPPAADAPAQPAAARQRGSRK